MTLAVEAKEPKRQAFHNFEWEIWGQRIEGTFTELTPLKDGCQDIGVAVRLPYAAQNIQMGIVNRKIERRDSSGSNPTIKEEECYTISYWDEENGNGRLILLPRTLFFFNDGTQVGQYKYVNWLRAFTENGGIAASLKKGD